MPVPACRTSTTALAIISAVLCPWLAHAATPSEAAIYSFTGGTDGGFPHAGLIASRAANALYGTTSSDGTGHNGVIFKATPPAAGQTGWTETVLYAFTGGNDGGIPYASLLEDSTGALYGTTEGGGASGEGVVFKLTPPASGKTAWTETVLHSFTGGNDGGEPWSPVIADSSGNLYGTATIGGSGVVGCVWKLTPPAAGHSGWSETVLYNFTGNADGGEPFGRVVFGPGGSLLGTANGYGEYNYGTIYALTPPAGTGSTWGFQLLHAFRGGNDGSTPRDGLTASAGGTFYGTTAGFDNSYGSVYSLAETANKGIDYKVLYNFSGPGFTGNGPWQTVAIDSVGNLYGTTLGDGGSSDGVAFKLAPPAAGSSQWTETVLHAFQGGTDGQFLYAKPVVIGTTVYGTTEGAGSEAGFFPGNVWQIKQ